MWRALGNGIFAEVYAPALDPTGIRMKLPTALLFAMWLTPPASQDYTSISQAVDHVFQVTTFSYPGFKGYVKLGSTQRIPEAKGKVWIARESARTTIDARVDDLPPSQIFRCCLQYVCPLVDISRR